MSTTSGAIGKERSHGLLIFVMVLAFLVAVVDFVWLNIKNDQERQAAQLTAQIQVVSQQISKYAFEAAGGNIESFNELDSTRNALDSSVQRLDKGDAKTGMPGYAHAAAGVGNSLAALTQAWNQLNGDVSKVLANRALVLNSADQAGQFARQMPILNSRMDEVVNILQQRNGSAAQTFTAARQMLLADRMIRRVQEILQGGEGAATAADGLSRDAQLYSAVLKGLVEGNPDFNIRAMDNASARQILEDIQKTWGQLGDPVQKLVTAAPTLQDVKDAANQASLDSQNVLLRANEVSTNLGKLPTLRPFPNLIIGAIAALITLVCAVVLAWALINDQRRRGQVTTELNQRNQEAILRLLDEMGSLAEGDLTVKATVTEDITGAIADSVNFAVEALRSLVTTINETAVQVSAAAQETQATAMHLAEAAEHQAQQITSASAAINEIAVSIDEVSKNSAESAEVAQRSVQIASKGAGIVRQTIQGMDSIREQIQETSKRIKRLGESSQEIGSIVELINDIAEQTNILALNAAIQAASAGEAGRGFAVVADEVQRLAERASNATKRIETLVQTIQSDTNEAVSSMEQTTAEVVAGARLAEDAGTALGEIEKVSNDLADLIQNISEAARQQSAAATNISATMNVIQEITAQTSVGASQTAESIGNLAQLAADLRRSVADFKLPNY
ncbi:MAG: methyl-accepting chemotaxis protein [Mizugakiibacter sp.]|uniref:methyl-accepting chemotaxis protein n=1 Tax=Mizugakiibacter sp. TaxID=1972610 RepID=UPI0031C10A78|nr:methyl-accepting chemotaxis protein [Xanthomonadaceae bacterium]